MQYWFGGIHRNQLYCRWLSFFQWRWCFAGSFLHQGWWCLLCRLAVLQRTMVHFVIHVRNSNCTHTIAPALFTCRNIVSGDVEHVDTVLDVGLIANSSALLHSSNGSLDEIKNLGWKQFVPIFLFNYHSRIIKVACWLLSIAARTEQQITQVIKGTCGLLQHVTKMFFCKDAIKVPHNISIAGTTYQVMTIIEYGVIDAYYSILSLNDVKIFLVALHAVSNIL